jgi:MbtH protein
MNFNKKEGETVYTVVVNHEDQYSIWREDQSIPTGWRQVGHTGSKTSCLSYILDIWTDMSYPYNYAMTPTLLINHPVNLSCWLSPAPRWRLCCMNNFQVIDSK